MCVYLRAKFEVSSIILTSFRQRGGRGGGAILLPPPASIVISEKPTQIKVNKVAGLQGCSFNKKRLQHRYFPLNIEKFLRTHI